jgi:hypothetical protein
MISLILCLVLGIIDAAKDQITFRYKYSVFANLNSQFWDPIVSWKNKYKLPLEQYKSKWYHFKLFEPLLTERFAYSTTAFIFITDAWHLLKALYIMCIICIIFFYSKLVGLSADIILCYCAYSFTFNLFENKLFNGTYWKYRK